MNPHILPHDPPCLTPTTFQAIVDTLPSSVGLVGKTVVAAARSGSIYGRSSRCKDFFANLANARLQLSIRSLTQLRRQP
jgi:hypothetical protein